MFAAGFFAEVTLPLATTLPVLFAPAVDFLTIVFVAFCEAGLLPALAGDVVFTVFVAATGAFFLGAFWAAGSAVLFAVFFAAAGAILVLLFCAITGVGLVTAFFVALAVEAVACLTGAALLTGCLAEGAANFLEAFPPLFRAGATGLAGAADALLAVAFLAVTFFVTISRIPDLTVSIASPAISTR